MELVRAGCNAATSDEQHPALSMPRQAPIITLVASNAAGMASSSSLALGGGPDARIAASKYSGINQPQHFNTSIMMRTATRGTLATAASVPKRETAAHLRPGWRVCGTAPSPPIMRRLAAVLPGSDCHCCARLAELDATAGCTMFPSRPPIPIIQHLLCADCVPAPPVMPQPISHLPGALHHSL